jgi:hypothetical protein
MTRGLLMSVPLVALVVALTAAGAEKATSGTSAIADSGDPPGRVARLNYLSGSVSFQPAGTNTGAMERRYEIAQLLADQDLAESMIRRVITPRMRQILLPNRFACPVPIFRFFRL